MQVTLGSLESQGSGIYFPTAVTVSISDIILILKKSES
jgi:hypothetical protein